MTKNRADFAHDAVVSGRSIRVLSVVDECTRECLTLEVDTSLRVGGLHGALEAILEERDKPADPRGRSQGRGIAWVSVPGVVLLLPNPSELVNDHC